MCIHWTRVECKIQEWNEEVEASIFALIGFLRVFHETIPCNGSIFPFFPSVSSIPSSLSPSLSLGFFHSLVFFLVGLFFDSLPLLLFFCRTYMRPLDCIGHGTRDLTGNKFRSVSLKPFADQRRGLEPIVEWIIELPPYRSTPSHR